MTLEEFVKYDDKNKERHESGWGDVYCWHCSNIITSEAEDVEIEFTLDNKDTDKFQCYSLWFHLQCFRLIAGNFYIPEVSKRV